VLESKYKPGRTNRVADALRISRKAELVSLKGEELAAICRIHGTLPERGRFRERPPFPSSQSFTAFHYLGRDASGLNYLSKTKDSFP